MNDESWIWCPAHRQPGKIVDRIELWGEVTLRVWLPQTDAVVRLRQEDVLPIEEAPQSNIDRVRYLIYASRLANLLSEDVLLAPVDSAVIPLPHQLKALRKAVSRDRIRVLLADEVGLGKTIEAGLILRELKLRGLVRRTLVVAPKGLITQWIAEMDTHFGEDFRFFSPSDFAGYRRIAREQNVWRTGDQVICSLDSIKPMEKRRGWSPERIADYNRDRIHDLAAAGWDLIVVDEAHRLGGSSEQVARHQLGKVLAEASPYLLLLSATPHQGKTDAFHRIMTLIDDEAFPDESAVTRERVAPYVIRTEKRHAITAEGDPLFQPRRTELMPVQWEGHDLQHQLYEAVTEYAREGYNRAMRENQNAVGFLMILMQRLVTSSTRAIIGTLRRRLDILHAPEMTEQLFLDFEEWVDLDGESQLETVMQARSADLQGEQAEVAALLEQAQRVEAAGLDAKAEALLDHIYRLQQEESEPDLKVLIFTEFVPSQEMLAEFLESRGISVVRLNGSMGMDDRRKVQEQFAGKVRVLISTDAGGEGLNLQFCHVVINFDLPWNPMRLEQRIGRVDRIGQKHVVRAINLVFEDTVEFRVRDVLEAKLAVILEEFGVDKTGDVLDSAEAGRIFDGAFIRAFLKPDNVEQETTNLINAVREEASRNKSAGSLLADDSGFDPQELARLRSLPLAHWLEQLVTHYVTANGGSVEKDFHELSVRWPGEEETVRYQLAASGGTERPGDLLTLDHPRIRALYTRLPAATEWDGIPECRVSGVPADVAGIWSLWRVRMLGKGVELTRFFPLFLHDDGRVLAPTARFLWERLTDTAFAMSATIDHGTAGDVFAAVRTRAVEEGKTVFAEVRREHLESLERESEKVRYSFASRRRMMEKIGLPEVRDFRMRNLRQEEADWKRELQEKKLVTPELDPVLVLHIQPA